ncbi:MAG: helix-hairpin-helix domain-containing protein [Armatimonadota bacterium]
MPLRKHRGVALITAIWILVVLLILVGGFAAVIHSETQIARNFGDMTCARWAAREGVRRAEVMVGQVAAQPYTALTDEQRLLTSPEGTGAVDETAYEVAIEDEAGKLNLNTATREQLGALFPAEVADAIIDWRDEDGIPGAQGAEEEYYAELSPPYHCKNAPFTTVGELRLVAGVDDDLLAEQVTEDGKTREDLLTVSSSDSNTDAEGQPRLNINTASKEEFTERCGDVLSSQDIDAIIRRRGSRQFASPADLLQISRLGRNKVAQVYDRLTTSDAETRIGLINLNTAPAEVLALLPGMTESAVQAIIARRDEQGPFAGVGELLQINSISTSVFRQLAGSLTARSRTFGVRSTGRTADGITHTVTCLLQVETNGGETTTRTLYWRE